jgi:hypothetical protein
MPRMTPLSSVLGFCAIALYCGIAVPAQAQMGGALNPANPISATPGLHRPSTADEPPPPALPGGSGIDTNSQAQVRIDNEDPTKVLFTAINHGNYAEARAAVSRGANLTARNALGETPIEMSVALNRNNITFMLLSMHAADTSNDAAAIPAAAPSPVASPVRARTALAPANRSPAAQAPAAQVPVNQVRAVPNPAAGFLGFNGAS